MGVQEQLKLLRTQLSDAVFEATKTVLEKAKEDGLVKDVIEDSRSFDIIPKEDALSFVAFRVVSHVFDEGAYAVGDSVVLKNFEYAGRLKIVEIDITGTRSRSPFGSFRVEGFQHWMDMYSIVEYYKEEREPEDDQKENMQ